MESMQDLIEAEYKIYKILERNKSSFSKGHYTEKKTLMEKYHIPEEAIIEAHNEGWIMDICAPYFIELRHPLSKLEREISFGKYVPRVGYTLTDLDGVNSATLYGQMNITSAKKDDVIGEHIRELQNQQMRTMKDSIISIVLDTDELREKARLQKNCSSRTRIQNARAVIEGADLCNALKLGYLEEKKDLEEGLSVAKEILLGIKTGRWTLEFKEKQGLSKEQLKKFSDLYADGGEVETHSDRINVVSEKLEKIENCRKILANYGLITAKKGSVNEDKLSELPTDYTINDNLINPILKIPVMSLSTAWIEVK